MFETIDKLMLASLGALSMTREKAEKIFDDYVNKGEIEKEKKSGFVKDMMESADKTRGDLEKMISEQINEALKKLNFARREDIERLEKKVDKLLARR